MRVDPNSSMRLILASASPRRAELLRSAGYTFDVVVADVDESIRPGESPSLYVRRLAAEKSAAALRRITADLKVRTTLDGTALPADPKVFTTADGRAGTADLKVCTTSDGTALPADPKVFTTADGRAGTADLKVCTTSDGTRSDGTEVVQAFRPADSIVLGADTTVVVDGEILGKPRDDEDGRAMLRRLSGKTHQVMTGVSLRRGAFEVGRVEISSVVFRAMTEEDISWYAASGEGRDKAGGYAIQGLASRFIPSISGSYANVVGLPVATVAELLRSLLASRL
jgi:MAF protein